MQTQLKMIVGAVLISTTATALAATIPESWPRLIGDARNPPCGEALEIARLVYRLDEPYTYAPPPVAETSTSTLVLGPAGLDISGGDDLKADDSFRKMPIEAVGRSVYWQKAATLGYRLVVRETPVGWRGDTYGLFALPEGVTAETFLEVAGTGKEWPGAIMEMSWRPPLIFRDKASGMPWVIDVGPPYEFLSRWNVYRLTAKGLHSDCGVIFHPPVKSATDLLPPAVRELERLLDATLGSGKDDGTLQSTARLRIEVQMAWGNAAMRPWATVKPYNTREEVDAGLEAWAVNARRRGIYDAIQRQYPIAERALAGYYGREFGLTSERASAIAAYMLDIVFRFHYGFHTEREVSDSRKTVGDHPWGALPRQ